MDYYEALGVPRGADLEAIKDAYRRLALRWHPDRMPTEQQKREAHTKFCQIGEAYSVLSDATARTAYDASLDETATGGPPPAQGQVHEAATRGRRTAEELAARDFDAFVTTLDAVLAAGFLLGAGAVYGAFWTAEVAVDAARRAGEHVASAPARHDRRMAQHNAALARHESAMQMYERDKAMASRARREVLGRTWYLKAGGYVLLGLSIITMLPAPFIFVGGLIWLAGAGIFNAWPWVTSDFLQGLAALVGCVLASLALALPGRRLIEKAAKIDAGSGGAPPSKPQPPEEPRFINSLFQR